MPPKKITAAKEFKEPPQHTYSPRPLSIKRCDGGHRYHGKYCYQCYIEGLRSNNKVKPILGGRDT